MPGPEMRADAWLVEKLGPDRMRWRGVVYQRKPDIGGFKVWGIAWWSSRTYKTRTSAMSHAKAHLRAATAA